LGSLDGIKLGLVKSSNDGLALKYSLGIEDGAELGDAVGMVDVEGTNDGKDDGDVLEEGCADG
jgi:hypothetical protein